MTSATVIFTAWITVGGVASTSAQQKPPLDPALVRVYLHTDDGGHPDELKARQESVKHLAESLAKQKKLLALVESEEQADVSVEVVERRVTVPKLVVGVGARPGQPPAAPARAVQLLVRLTHRRVSEPLANKNSPLESSRGWVSAADDVAKQIESWIKDNRARIIDGRERDDP